MAEPQDRHRGRQSGPRRPRSSQPRSRTAPSGRSRNTDLPRLAAYRVLRDVADGGYANLVLPEELRAARLSGRDAAFATELCYGTLRMQGLYDVVLSEVAGRPSSTLDAPLLDILRLGAHQILSMRVPAHAAVDASVGLTRAQVGIGPSGLVNAVLRKLVEAAPTVVDDVVQRADGEVARLALQHSHPEWVARALRAALLGHGASTPEAVSDDLDALLDAHNTAGPIGLVARPGLGAEDELATAGAHRHPVVPTAWLLESGDPGSIAAIRQGRAAVQDPGSQAVALTLLAADVPDDRGEWLDLCAGPGGKSGLLAAAALQRGARLVCNEVSPHRAELVRSTLRAAVAAGADVEVVTGDGRQVGERWPERFDRVLVDAPCTGLGALRRRPEARWRRTPQDLPVLTALQRELLVAAADATREGGVLVYATCSPHLAETQAVVSGLLSARPDLRQEDARTLVPGGPGWLPGELGPGPGVQLWPHRQGTDGMFMALLRKIGPASAPRDR